MVEDQSAYGSLTAARKLPATDPDRAAKIDVSLAACIGAPEAIGATAAAILKLCDQLVDRVNKYLLSDLAVCAELAMATVRCAAYNVRVNLNDIVNPTERYRIDSGASRLVVESSKTIQRVIPRIWDRQQQQQQAQGKA